MPCLRQNAVNAGYDSAAPPAVSSSWTRTRFPLQEVKRSRICCRWGSAFSARWISGTLVEFDCSTLRTVSRDNCNTRAISRLLTPFALSSRIAVRCAWLNMLLLLLWDSPGQTAKLVFHAFDLAPRCFALPAIHLQAQRAPRRARQPPGGAVHDRCRHLQIAQQFGGRRCRSFRFRLPLRFEKQLGLVEKALPNHRRATAPGGIQLPGLPGVAVMLG